MYFEFPSRAAAEDFAARMTEGRLAESWGAAYAEQTVFPDGITRETAALFDHPADGRCAAYIAPRHETLPGPADLNLAVSRAHLESEGWSAFGPV